ncbi:hypothetical protein BCR34DRAFT_607808 [Clohesyomyces aquaticus]|uniref:Necrosis-inducing factor-domain-containing protein n=1 Tax=Clohesyomyces aquaticus TaxID=1231657 RepID=A0A1Y1YD73_9PLEO|nr:hypothetical protein BCR34DRAFT_607808 [Clohesyomyces aquaticus]
MRAILLPLLFATLNSFISCASIPPRELTATKPLKIRECLTLPYQNTSAVSTAISTLEANLQALKNSISVSRNMGSQRFRATSDGTCVELLMQNWSCDHDLSLDGKNMAWAVESIANQCGGPVTTGKGGVVSWKSIPSGWGYYMDDTGYDFGKHMWAILRPCQEKPMMSACSPGAMAE